MSNNSLLPTSALARRRGRAQSLESNKDMAINIRKFFLFAAVLVPFVSHGETSVVGTWELVYVAPTDVELTEPRGITNTKMYFTADGKVTGIKPDERITEKTQFGNYKFDGKRVTLTREGSQPYAVGVSFPDSETMLFSPPHASQRKFKRIAGPNIELEPKSLQLVKVSSGAFPAGETAYDTGDYSKLPLEQRIRGVWEIISYRKVPRNQAPPYGFFNDLWVIKDNSILITRRNAKGPNELPYSLVTNNIMLSASVLGGPTETRLEWKASFDKWGHLILDRQNAQIVFKLISKDTAKTADVPIKIVLLSLEGE